MNVMIVDDQRSSLVLLGKLVELSGGTPFAFLDPAEALRQAQSVVFDLALVDYRMPAMDGLSFIKMLRALVPSRRWLEFGWRSLRGSQP
jgi:putative two-component system response regulator